MSAPQYFVLGPVRGSVHTRYAVLGAPAGAVATVIEVLASRPDGTEVRQPKNVRLRLQPFVGGPVRRRWFNNVPPMGRPDAPPLMKSTSDADLAAARVRGQEKLQRVIAERRVRRAAA